MDVTKKEQLGEMKCPTFMTINNQNYICLHIKADVCYLYDYESDVLFEYTLEDNFQATICYTSSYSRLFREPPPESQDKNNWIKYSFYRYNDEFKNLMKLSLAINLLGALQPFFIMSVYSNKTSLS